MIVKVVLLSSIPGTRISQCADNLVQHALGLGKRVRTYCVEDALLANAVPLIEKLTDKYGRPDLSDLLSLPLDELFQISSQTWLGLLTRILAEQQEHTFDWVLLTAHPILYHQLTREFISLDLANDLKVALQAVGNDNVELSHIVSVHDDIYDCYRPLLLPWQVLHPEFRRERGSLTKRRRQKSGAGRLSKICTTSDFCLIGEIGN